MVFLKLGEVCNACLTKHQQRESVEYEILSLIEEIMHLNQFIHSFIMCNKPELSIHRNNTRLVVAVLHALLRPTFSRLIYT